VVSFPFRIRRNPSRPSRRPVGALIVIVALVASFAGLATVSPANADTTLAGSPFDGTNGTLDDNAGPAHPDLPEGSGDDSYKGGAKEDDLCPTVEDGSIQNKGELTNVYIATGEGGTDTFLYLAFERLETASQNGTVALDFELNQSTDLACNGVNPVRTIGDKLITYEFRGSTPALGVRITVGTWDGDEWVGAEVPLSSEAAEGSINDARTFGEMVINLEEAGIFTRGQCDNFSSVFTKGRSSSAEARSSELKDFIAPVPQHVANCGPLTVSKTVVGGKVGDKFDFTVNCPGTDNDESFSLMTGESQTFKDIPLEATCVVTETDPAMSAWWTTTYDIGAGTTNGRTANVVIDPDGESVAFNNAAKPNGIVLDKKVDGADHATIEDALIVHKLVYLTYTVVVTNSGQVPLTITALTDSLYSAFASSCAQGVGSTLAEGKSFTCTYQVPADGDAHNVATASAVDEANRPVSDDDDTFVAVVVPAAIAPLSVTPEVLGAVLELPRTGSPIGWFAGIALLLVAGGFTLRRMGRRPQRAS
jgi:hypothetical protein